MITIFIGGPTASGKTKVAEGLAASMNGEIISCDSRTAYRHLDIGTGKIFNSPDIIYHMVDIIEPGTVLTTSEFVILSRSIIDDVKDRGRVPIICGGSSHLMERMIQGMEPAPDPSPYLRRFLKYEEMRKGKGHLYSILEQLDPDLASKVHPNDSHRILRYIENVLSRTDNERIPPLECSNLILYINTSIISLRKRIEERCDLMLEKGWIQEVRSLKDMGFDKASAGCDSIGYPSIFDLLDGKLTMEECREKIISDTVVFARKQKRWKKRLKGAIEMDLKDHGLDTVNLMVREITEKVKEDDP